MSWFTLYKDVKIQTLQLMNLNKHSFFINVCLTLILLSELTSKQIEIDTFL